MDHLNIALKELFLSYLQTQQNLTVLGQWLQKFTRDIIVNIFFSTKYFLFPQG